MTAPTESLSTSSCQAVGTEADSTGSSPEKKTFLTSPARTSEPPPTARSPGWQLAVASALRTGRSTRDHLTNDHARGAVLPGRTLQPERSRVEPHLAGRASFADLDDR